MEEKRINGGYEIIESCTIGNNELVIGHNAKAPNRYDMSAFAKHYPESAFAGSYCTEYCTGITQNVDDLLQSHTARTMLANSEFIIMLNQASTDRIELFLFGKIYSSTETSNIVMS